MYQYDDPTAISVRPAPTPPGSPGWFTDGDPAAGAQATILRAEFMNMLMGEVLSILSAAGVEPKKDDSSQLLAALRSAGVFQTAPKFDQSTKAATNAFVKAMGIEASGQNLVTGSTALTAAMAGSIVYNTAAGAVITLPDPSTLPVGAGYFVVANVSGTLACSTGLFAQTGQTTLALSISDTVWLNSDGTNWNIVLKTNLFNAASLNGNGYQKLPSGLIIQWGSVLSSGAAAGNATATFPIAFPNSCLWAGGVIAAAGAASNFTVQTGVPTASSLPMTTLSGSTITTGLTVNYLAIGK